MRRNKKIKSPKIMEEQWEVYKTHCEDKSVLTHNFNSKSGEYVSAELRHSVTCTVEGFCNFLEIARSNFYETYCEDESYRDIVTRIREECEVDAREKFELGVIPPQLAALWMSKYGYSVKQDATITGEVVKIVDDI